MSEDLRAFREAHRRNQLESAAFMQAITSAVNGDIGAIHHAVPSLEDVVAAWMADEIDWLELDLYIEAAVFGKAIELPLALQTRAYTKRQSQVRFTDAPGRIAKYRPVSRPQHTRNVEAVLKGAYGTQQERPR